MSNVKVSKNFFTRLYNLSLWYKITDLEGWRLQRRMNVHRLVIQDMRKIFECIQAEKVRFTFEDVLEKAGEQFLKDESKLNKAKKFLKKQLKRSTMVARVKYLGEYLGYIMMT